MKIIALLLIVPFTPTIEDRCDVAELNHFYDENGRLIFDQVIYYKWSSHTERHEVIAWRLVKHESQIPARDWEGGGYVAVFSDGDISRRVRSDSFRESWTQYDPELAEREYLDKAKRCELRKANK